MKIRVKRRSALTYIFLVVGCIMLLSLAIFQGKRLLPLIKTALPQKQASLTPTPTLIKPPSETEVLKFPSPNATDQERTAYATLVAKFAKATDTVTIKDCKPDPIAIEVSHQQTITFKNSDAVPHTIAKDTTHTIEIPANGEATMVIDFDETSGIYAYGCDNSASGVGVIAIPQ